MRARLHDPDGPAWVRFVLPALGLVCIGFGLYVRVVDGPGVGATFFVDSLWPSWRRCSCLAIDLATPPWSRARAPSTCATPVF